MPDEQQDNSDHLVPPDLRGRYSDFSLIGAGGMGRVIGAHDNHLDRAVAIKLLPRNSENVQAVMRFQQEAKAVSKLNNPHIVQVLDFDYSESGEPYLVMEHVKGQGLESLLEEQGALPIPEAITIAEQLCSALEHAHANNVVHRDLKPSNIMLNPSNTVKVLDFGLARILSLDETDWRLTRPGQPVGSILYMSPEQVRGEEADERADIYSLGLLILKMVSGELPYEGMTALDVIARRLDETPPAIPETDDDKALRDALNEVVQKALSIRREDRYQNMAEFKKALLNVPERAHELATTAANADSESGKTSIWIKVIVAIALIGVAAFAVSYFTAPKKTGHHNKHHHKTSEKQPGEKSTKGGSEFDPKFNPLLKDKFTIWNDEPPETGRWGADPKVTDEDLALLKGFPITEFECRFGNENVSYKGIEALSSLPLRHLSIRDTHIDDRCIPAINNMTKLVVLDVQNTPITDKGIMQLSPSLKLVHLDVKKLAKLTDVGVQYIIKTWPDLEFLNISSSTITKSATRRLLGKLKKLKTLRASAIDFTDDDLTYISHLKLEELELENNNITEKSIPTLKKMTSLRILKLKLCTKITSNGLDELRRSMPQTNIFPEVGKLPAKTDRFDFYKMEN